MIVMICRCLKSIVWHIDFIETLSLENQPFYGVNVSTCQSLFFLYYIKNFWFILKFYTFFYSLDIILSLWVFVIFQNMFINLSYVYKEI